MRLPPSVSLVFLAVLAAAAPAPSYHALDSGARVPIPQGYRAVSRPMPEDPDSEIVVLFERGDPAQALAAAEPKDGRIVVEIIALSEKQRKDPAFPRALEAGLRKKAAARVGKASYSWMKGAPYKTLSYRQKSPDLVQLQLFAPSRFVRVTAEIWTPAVAEIVKGYKDAGL